MEPVEQKVEHGSAVWSGLFGVVSRFGEEEEEESTFALVNHRFPILRLHWKNPRFLKAGCYFL